MVECKHMTIGGYCPVKADLSETAEEVKRLTAINGALVYELNKAEAQVTALKKALANISYWSGTGNTEATMLSKRAYDALASLEGGVK